MSCADTGRVALLAKGTNPMCKGPEVKLLEAGFLGGWEAARGQVI